VSGALLWIRADLRPAAIERRLDQHLFDFGAREDRRVERTLNDTPATRAAVVTVADDVFTDWTGCGLDEHVGLVSYYAYFENIHFTLSLYSIVSCKRLG
jgi:hypothetical protein